MSDDNVTSLPQTTAMLVSNIQRGVEAELEECYHDKTLFENLNFIKGEGDTEIKNPDEAERCFIGYLLNIHAEFFEATTEDVAYGMLRKVLASSYHFKRALGYPQPSFEEYVLEKTPWVIEEFKIVIIAPEAMLAFANDNPVSNPKP